MRIVALILLLLFSSNHLFADSIESVLKIKPPIKYNQNQKYDKIKSIVTIKVMVIEKNMTLELTLV